MAIIGEPLEKKENKSECICKNQYKLPWGNKISCEARKKVVQICAELWGEGRKIEMAKELMICIAMETGGSFKPSEGYPYATGLIQFTGTAIKDMNDVKFKGKYNEGNIFTKENLKSMTVERQLDYVKYYFQVNINEYKKKIENALDMYMCIFCPNAAGQSNDFVCYKKGGSSYKSNASIDGETYDDVKHKKIPYPKYKRDENKK